MGVYIKGIEMPTRCRECRFCNGIADTDYGVCAWCDVDGKLRDAYTKQDCPLVYFPPHGRLIDADALCKKLRSFVENEYSPKTFANWIDNHIDTVIPAEEDFHEMG